MSGWAWKPPAQVRVALNRGDRRYAEYRRKLVERAAAARREATARNVVRDTGSAGA